MAAASDVEPIIHARKHLLMCLCFLTCLLPFQLLAAGTLCATNKVILSTGFEDLETQPACHVLSLYAGVGGFVSYGDDHQCIEADTCMLESDRLEQHQISIKAHPRTGYSFTGWKTGEEYLCTDQANPCLLDLEELTDPPSEEWRISPTFLPEGSIFFPPEGHVGMCRIENIDSLEVHCEIKDFQSYGYGPLSDYVVTDPNVLFVDIEARRRELDTLSPEIKDSWCANGSGGWPNYWQDSGIDPASYTPDPPDDIWDDATLNQLGIPMLFARLYYDYFDDPDAVGLIVRSLRVYAEANIWMDVDLSTDGENRQYNLGLNMYIYQLAWKSVRNEPAVSSEDRRIIDEYLYRLIQLLTKYSSQESGSAEPILWREVTNHQNPKEISTMMYGILTKNDILFQRGIKRFFVILDGTVRPDGSHIYESQRGGSALDYSLGKTAELIRLAELAANQGYDLYTVEVKGVSLTDITEFHVAAFEDETLLHPYSGNNEKFCDPEQCALWNDLYNKEIGHPKERGWPEFEIFRARFPESLLIEQFQNISPDNEHIYKQEGPYFQGCEFRDVSTAGS